MIDVFVISPYTDDDPAVVAHRVEQAEEYVASLVKRGIVVYSTIAAMAHIVEKYNICGDWGFWKKHCIEMIECSDVVHVLMLDGYEDSTGVTGEIQAAIVAGKDIHYVEPIK